MSEEIRTDAARAADGGEGEAARLCDIAKAPCKSCPYRVDVPSGLWAATEYDKLLGYDGEILDQAMAGSGGLFLCHQQDGNLCAGWVATHGAHNLLALRLHGHQATDAVWTYQSPVPVFSSGADAARHGRAQIAAPLPRARRAIDRLARKQAMRPPSPSPSPPPDEAQRLTTPTAEGYGSPTGEE